MSQPASELCPICGKPAIDRYKPFCSKRCADVDLSRWLKGSYAIPGEPAGDEDEMPSQTPENGVNSDE